MDEAISALQREVFGGADAQRRALLQALVRAGRPLGEAWPAGEVTVDVEPRWVDDALLERLAAFDRLRVLEQVADGSAVGLFPLDALDEPSCLCCFRNGPTLRLRSLGWEDGAHDWRDQPGRWRRDAPAPVRLLAGSSDGRWAAAERLGRIEVGAPDELERGAPRWTHAIGGVRALGFVARRLLVVTAADLRIHDAQGGHEVHPPRALPGVRVAAVGADGALVLSEGGLELLASDGRPRWQVEITRHHLAGRPSGVALGAGLAALCAGHVWLWDAVTGESRGRCARGTQRTHWEDPESTMGLGRDSRTIEAERPDLREVAFRDDLELVTLDAQRELAAWKRSPRGGARRLGTRLGRADGPLVALPDGRVATCFGGIDVYGAGRTPTRLLAPPGTRALAACGEGLLVGTEGGEVVRVAL